MTVVRHAEIADIINIIVHSCQLRLTALKEASRGQ